MGKTTWTPPSPPRVSPWANKTIAPLQAAGALVPIVETPNGWVFDDQRHGTAFFISESGFFLTAAHVIDEFPNLSPPLKVVIMSAYGTAVMPVAFITRHPEFDIALGLALVDPDHPTKINSLTLSRKALQPGDHVAVLGYQNSKTHYSQDVDGQALSRFTFTPDFYEGDILDVHADGVSLVKGPAYSTDIVPPPPVKDFSGLSGGPLVAPATLHVHGILSSASDDYTLCSDIRSALEWDVFEHDTLGNVSIEAFSARYEGVIRIAED